MKVFFLSYEHKNTEWQNSTFVLKTSALIITFHLLYKQAGTGPSRRHIQGSKIAKGHQSFKVFSSTALKIFFEKVSQRRKN